MNRDDVTELHYIAPLANVDSILRHGILCRERAASIMRDSCADPEVLARRKRKPVLNGLLLPQYVNFYFSARNAMLYKISRTRDDLCVLRVSPNLLDHPRAVISTRNAATYEARFLPARVGLAHLDKQDIFRHEWDNDDEMQRMMAELLFPERVSWIYILGAYVSCRSSQRHIESLPSWKPWGKVKINSRMFFR